MYIRMVRVGETGGMLDTVLGQGRSSVKVSAVLNMKKIVTETIAYEKGVPSRESTTTTSKEQGSSTDADGKETSLPLPLSVRR